ncbi:hypothetical protein OIY81_2698 [Cryptosporidium canis]|uniref:RecQ mediated genome instability protein 1 OB-fold domain-containing protein n=1 Tax=Cryptosporidium canis TaxID=195482 RepID=A0ABQ8PB27_9CRYT|nr:hypothetical protein OIY81_2698 [Cryptosporidium canis]KAJ1614299.1 hypothetical protein OJ252_712 [Cryptosporidium canis]
MSGSLAERLLRELRIQIGEEVEEQLDPYRGDYDEYSAKLLKLLLSTDLSRIVKRGSLPLDILSLHKVSLGGVHLLQLLEAEDVSKPKSKNRFYFSSRAERMQGVSITPPSKNRMMRLVFTDGASVFPAMEYKYLPELDGFIQFWCDYREGVEKRRILGSEARSGHVVVLLSGEPEIKRGVVLLLPGMLTFVMHADMEQGTDPGALEGPEALGRRPTGGSSSSILSDKRPDKRQTKAIKGNMDIRSYSNFVISSTLPSNESCQAPDPVQERGAQPDTSSVHSSSLKEDELLLQRLEIRDGGLSEGDGSDSSVVEVLPRPSSLGQTGVLGGGEHGCPGDLECIDGFGDYADLEIREDLECQDEDSCDLGTLRPDSPGGASYCVSRSSWQRLGDPADAKELGLVIWVEAAVISSRRSESDEDEMLLELGIHYPAPLPQPWDELLLQDVSLTRQVAEKILSVDGDGESPEDRASPLSIDSLVLLVRFIQGNMCLNVSSDSDSREARRVNLIGFVPT